VIVEETTRNITLVNCFTQRSLTSFPSHPFPFVVVAVLTDGLGEIQLTVQFQRLDTLDAFHEAHVSYRFTDPLQEVRCRFRITECSFPYPGLFEVNLLAGNDLLAHRRLQIVEGGPSNEE